MFNVSSNQNLAELLKYLDYVSNVKTHSDSLNIIATAKNSNWPNLILLNEPLEGLDIKAWRLFNEFSTIDFTTYTLLTNENISEESIEYLKHLGFVPVTFWTNMITHHLDPMVIESVPEFNIIEINSENKLELEDWISIVQDSLFAKKNLDSDLFANAIKGGKVSCFIGKYKGLPISTFMLFKGTDAGLYMVATRLEYRKKGIGKVMIDYAHAIAKESGYRKVVLQSTREGFPLYTSMKYETVDRSMLFINLKK